MIEGAAIDAVVDALLRPPDVPMATAVHPLPPEHVNDTNRVKVELDSQHNAQRFWRSAELAERSESSAPRWQHIGLYAYRLAQDR